MSTTDLVAIEPLIPIDPEQARVAMAKYRELTGAMLAPEDWQQIPGGRFVKRSGFQKIASGYGVSTEIVHEAVERDDDGQPVRASAVVRATHPTGRYADGSGRCSIAESRFATAKGRAKAEHDVAATAVTRATNRAISNLVGFGQVSAEEMDGVAPPPDGQALPYGPEGDAESDALVVQLIGDMYPGVDGAVFVGFVNRQLGTEHLPQASVRMMSAVQWALGDERMAKAVDAEPVAESQPGDANGGVAP